MVPCLKVLQHRGVLQCPVPVPAVALHRLHIEAGIFLRSWVNFSAIILEYFRCTSKMFILILIYISHLIWFVQLANPTSPDFGHFRAFTVERWVPKTQLFLRCRRQVEVLALGVPIPAVADPEVLRMGSQKRCQWQISKDWCLNDITDSSYYSAFFLGVKNKQ